MIETLIDRLHGLIQAEPPTRQCADLHYENAKGCEYLSDLLLTSGQASGVWRKWSALRHAFWQRGSAAARLRATA